MYGTDSILHLILRSIFIGFGFVIPILAFLKTSDLTKLKFKQLFILTAIQAVRVGGLFYGIYYLIKIAEVAFGSSLGFNDSGHWFLFWFSPVMYFLLSQIFWLRSIYSNKVTLVIFSLFFLLVPTQKFMMEQIAFYKKFTPIRWTMFSVNPIIEYALFIIVFIFIIITIMLAGNKFKQIKQ